MSNLSNSNSGNIAKASFLNGPDVKLKVQSVYEKSGFKDVVNSIQDKGKEYGVDFSAFVKGGKDLAKLWPIINTIKGGDGPGNILNRLLANSNQLSTALKPLYNHLPENFQELSSGLYEEYGDTFVKVGNLTQKVMSSDLSSIDGIGKMINSISGDPNGLFIEDQDGIAAFTVGLVNEATRYGVPNSFDKLAGTIQNSDTMMKVCNGVLPIAVEASDIQMLRSISNRMGQGNLLSAAPGILGDFNANYSVDFTKDVEGMLNDYNDICTTFNEIDAEWKFYARINDEGTIPERILDGTVLAKSSDKMQEVFKLGAVSNESEDEKNILIAQGLQSNVYVDIDSMLPMLALLPMTKSSSIR